MLFTGFPGFLGSALLPRLLYRAADSAAVCLVQPKFAALAKRRLDEIAGADPRLAGRISLVEGDITRPDLGLADHAALNSEIREVFHLAAIYDLSVERDLAYRVNVQGTRNVLKFAHGCERLERLHHMSTCYVSGRHEGVFREGDLDVGQTFHNHYEETKYLAEMEVQSAIRDGMPATIYRPAIVVGDSDTGATLKFDGPYYIVRWILRWRRTAPFPVIGDPRAALGNIVPRDFVLAAITHLSTLSEAIGKVYQLADPDPLTIKALSDLLADAAGRRLLRVRVPLGAAKAALGYIPGLQRAFGVPAAALDYFAHPTRYAVENAVAGLEPAGIRVPRIETYASKLIEFVRAHPETRAEAMA